MGAKNSSRNKTLGIAKEVAYGTGVVPTAYPKFTSLSHGLKPFLVESKSRMGNRAKGAPMVDGSVGSIKIGFEADPDNIGWYLKGLCGTEIYALDAGAVGVYKHTFVPQNSADLPSFSVAIGTVVETILAVGAVVDSLSFDLAAKAIVTGSAELIYKEEAAQTPLSPVFTTTKPWVFGNFGLSIDGNVVADNVKLSLSCKNNLAGEDIRANSGGKIVGASAGGIDVTGSLDMVWTTATKALRDKMLSGQSSSVVVTLTGAQIEAGKNYKLVITLSEIYYDPTEVGDEEDGMMLPLPFKAAGGINPIVTFELYNTRATAY